MSPDAGSGRGDRSGVLVRVVTYNVHECVGRDGRLDPGRIANVLLEIDAEIMALQEMTLDPAGARVGRLEAVTRSRLIDGTLFHRRMARFGNVLLTRHAVIETRLHDLSCGGGEPRGVIEISLEVAHRPIRVCATHLGFMQCERSRQMELLAGLVRGSSGIALVLGDFNLWHSANAVPLFRHGFEQIPVRSFPTWPFPLLALDGIFARSPFTIERCWRHESKLARMASDHFPVVAEIGIMIPQVDLLEAL